MSKLCKVCGRIRVPRRRHICDDCKRKIGSPREASEYVVNRGFDAGREQSEIYQQMGWKQKPQAE